MTNLQLLKGCELHVHAAGCLWADDLLLLGRDVYQDVDWAHFIDSYEAAYGQRPDPWALYEAGLNNGRSGREQFRAHYVFSQADGGDFNRFQAKFNMLGCFYRHWRMVLQQEERLLDRIMARHADEGVGYVEYRALFNGLPHDPDGFLTFHRRHARAIQAGHRHDLDARYLISLPRNAPLAGYELVQQLFDETPELIPTIVGLDFCAVEEGFPPDQVRPFFERLQADNRRRPERALAVAYHVGESYFDKSLESAIRWCHDVAEMGARRLGHAIALGLDPAVAVARRPAAHEAEPVSERLAQIAYDLTWREALATYGVVIDVAGLEEEAAVLQRLTPEAPVQRPYTPQRLDEARRRQDFVLDRLAELDTVIESCPTSNLRIGGVPSPADHPIHRFLRSDVNLVISADDPGIFNVTLADEIDWVLTHTEYDPAALVKRLGDPYRFRLGQGRVAAR